MFGFEFATASLRHRKLPTVVLLSEQVNWKKLMCVCVCVLGNTVCTFITASKTLLLVSDKFPLSYIQTPEMMKQPQVI